MKVRFVDLAWPRGAATARRTPGRAADRLGVCRGQRVAPLQYALLPDRVQLPMELRGRAAEVVGEVSPPEELHVDGPRFRRRPSSPVSGSPASNSRRSRTRSGVSSLFKKSFKSVQRPFKSVLSSLYSLLSASASAPTQGVDAPHFPLFQNGLSSSCVQSWAVAAPQRAFRRAWGNYPRLPGAANLKGSVRRLNGTTGRNIKPGLKNRGEGCASPPSLSFSPVISPVFPPASPGGTNQPPALSGFL